jgi:antitoxin PrlF
MSRGDTTVKELQEYIGTLTSKGQVTIPVEIRRRLGLGPQDKIIFRVVDGRIEIEPLPMTLAETFGAVTPINQPEDFAKLRAIAIEEQAQTVMCEMQE